MFKKRYEDLFRRAYMFLLSNNIFVFEEFTQFGLDNLENRQRR